MTTNTTEQTNNQTSSMAQAVDNGAVQNPGFTPRRFRSEGEWIEWCESLLQKV